MKMNEANIANDISIDEIRAYIASVEWRFAKTMPKIPHWYTVAEWNPQFFEIFKQFVMYIRKNGYQQKFYDKEMTYFDLDGYKYWTMGSTLEETILINRAKLDNISLEKM